MGEGEQLVDLGVARLPHLPHQRPRRLRRLQTRRASIGSQQGRWGDLQGSRPVWGGCGCCAVCKRGHRVRVGAVGAGAELRAEVPPSPSLLPGPRCPLLPLRASLAREESQAEIRNEPGCKHVRECWGGGGGLAPGTCRRRRAPACAAGRARRPPAPPAARWSCGCGPQRCRLCAQGRPTRPRARPRAPARRSRGGRSGRTCRTAAGRRRRRSGSRSRRSCPQARTEGWRAPPPAL